MSKYVHKSDYFYGNKISEYGLKNNRIDYMTLAQAGDCVLANTLAEKYFDKMELENGTDYDEETEEYKEVFQWYVVSATMGNILEECTNELLYYVEEIDSYFWAVTHFGTSWDCVLTDIEIRKEN